MSIECPQCHHNNPDDAEFCENCGAQLTTVFVPGVATGVTPPAVAPAAAAAPQDTLVCPNCKAPYTTGDVFCFNCGYDLSKLPAVSGSGNAAAPAVPGPVPPTTKAPQVAPPANNQTDLSPDAFDELLAKGTPLPPANPAVPTPPQAAPPAQSAQPAQPPASAFTAPVAQVSKTGPINQGKLSLQITGPYGLEVVEYKDHELLLGRQDIKTRVFPDINLDDAASSRRHLSIWKDDTDNKYYAQDLESSNGTILNSHDMPSGEPVQLNDGDVIKIGTRYSILVRLS